MNPRTPLFSTGKPGLLSRFWRGWVYRTAIVLALLAATSVLAAAMLNTVSQKGRAFSRNQITITRGESIRFTNEDEFLHQIYVNSRGMVFDSHEQLPGQIIDVNFQHSGTFPVRCHIHPKMLLIVHVE
jgi:plastocyanin